MSVAAAAPKSGASAEPTRRADIDALRLAAVVLVLAVHTAQVYSPWQDWHIQNAERSRVLAHLMLFAGPWLMPLFMLLAGRSAYHALRHRSGRQWAADRLRRLFIPLAIGTFVLVPPQLWIRRLEDGSFHGSFASFYPHFFEGLYPTGNFSWGHLWFLAYLLLYSLLALPLLPALGRAARIASGRWLAGLAVAVAIGQVLLRAHFPQTNAMIGDWSNHALLLPAFLVGYILAARPGLEAGLRNGWERAIPVALAASLTVAALAGPDFDRGLLDDTSRAYVPFWIAFTIASGAWMLVLCGFAAAHVHRAVPAPLRDAVYPFYLLHQTVLVLVAWRIVPASLPVVVEYGLVFGIACAITTLGSAMLTHWGPSRLLLGLPRSRQGAAV